MSQMGVKGTGSPRQARRKQSLKGMEFMQGLYSARPWNASRGKKSLLLRKKPLACIFGQVGNGHEKTSDDPVLWVLFWCEFASAYGAGHGS
jgi:hypothetical protein